MTLPSVNRQIAKGAAWMVGLRLMDRSIGFVSTLILARLLFPADFGLVALAAGVTSLLELVLGFSLDVALIQRQEPTRAHYDTAWTLNLLFSVIIGLGLIGLSGPISVFYSEPRVGQLMLWLSIGIVFDGLANIGVVDFRRELQFHKDFAIALTRRLVVFTVTVTAAYVLRSYWALLIGILTGKFVYLVMSYIMHPYRPRLSLAERGALMGFSKWLLAHNIMSYAVSRGGEIALGKFISKTATGLFSVAHELASLPTAELVAPVNRAVFPAYARLADDLPRLRTAYLDVLGMTWLVAAPAAAGVAAISELLVSVMLGDRWAEAAVPIKILTIYTGLLAMQSNTGAVYTAVGRTGVIATLSFLKTAALIPLLIYLVPRHGLTGAAWSYAISTSLYTPYSFWILHKTIKMKQLEFVAVVWRPTASALGLYFLLPIVASAIGVPLLAGRIAALLAEVGLGALIYMVLMFSLWFLAGRPQGAEIHTLRIISAVAGRVFSRLSRADSGGSP